MLAEIEIVCSYCEKVMKKEVWIVRYKRYRSAIRWNSWVSHGICPNCITKIPILNPIKKED